MKLYLARVSRQFHGTQLMTHLTESDLQPGQLVPVVPVEHGDEGRGELGPLHVALRPELLRHHPRHLQQETVSVTSFVCRAAIHVPFYCFLNVHIRRTLQTLHYSLYTLSTRKGHKLAKIRHIQYKHTLSCPCYAI